MFPKGQQKKKDTVVVMVDGKSPQTIPTMDSPPEPQKIPKCRLLVVLTVVLILALLLLAGYCAWLFFSYETDVLPFKQTHDPDFIIRPTELSRDDNHVTTAPPKIKGNFFTDQNNDDNLIGDFVFSDSSVESVYDSSEPYGSSESAYPSYIWSEDVVSSSESESDSSLVDTTIKSDRFLWDKRKNTFMERWREWRDSLLKDKESGDYSSDDSEQSYYVMPSFWFQTRNDNELPFDKPDSESLWAGWLENSDEDTPSESSWTESSRFSSEWLEYKFGSGDFSDWDSELSSELYLGLDDDDYYSSEDGSGSFSSYYDVFEDFGDFIPQHLTPSPVIDRLPPERIEVAVCSWPSRIFERNKGESEIQLAQLSNHFSCVYDNSFSITSIDEKDGTTSSRTILSDFDNSIIAMNIKNFTTMLPTSVCYISFFPNVPEMDDNDSDYSGDYSGDYAESWDDEMEGSGMLDEVESLGQTVVIRNPVLLGGDIKFMSRRISDFCSTSTKFWASLITVKKKPHSIK